MFPTNLRINYEMHIKFLQYKSIFDILNSSQVLKHPKLIVLDRC